MLSVSCELVRLIIGLPLYIDILLAFDVQCIPFWKVHMSVVDCKAYLSDVRFRFVNCRLQHLLWFSTCTAGQLLWQVLLLTCRHAVCTGA